MEKNETHLQGSQKRRMTASLEDYLEAIYFRGGAESVRVTDIAEELGISKPSVNRAIRALRERGFVEHEHYGGLKLTEAGLAVAENVAFRHRTVKRFLTQALGVAEEAAEEEACLMEHSLSQDTVERLARFLDGLGKETP